MFCEQWQLLTVRAFFTANLGCKAAGRSVKTGSAVVYSWADALLRNEFPLAIFKASIKLLNIVHVL